MDEWAWNDDTLSNRDEYLETSHLTEEHYGFQNQLNSNENDINDDEPLPPPGLPRLVTGQTVSMDESVPSPAFDRLVTGQGDTSIGYPLAGNDKRTIPGQYSGEDHFNKKNRSAIGYSTDDVHMQKFFNDTEQQHSYVVPPPLLRNRDNLYQTSDLPIENNKSLYDNHVHNNVNNNNHNNKNDNVNVNPNEFPDRYIPAPKVPFSSDELQHRTTYNANFNAKSQNNLEVVYPYQSSLKPTTKQPLSDAICDAQDDDVFIKNHNANGAASGSNNIPPSFDVENNNYVNNNVNIVSPIYQNNLEQLSTFIDRSYVNDETNYNVRPDNEIPMRKPSPFFVNNVAKNANRTTPPSQENFTVELDESRNYMRPINDSSNPFLQHMREENCETSPQQITQYVHPVGNQYVPQQKRAVNQSSQLPQYVVSNQYVSEQKQLTKQSSQLQERMATEGAPDHFSPGQNIIPITSSSVNPSIDERNNYRMMVEGASRTSSKTGKNITSSQINQQREPSYDFWYSNDVQNRGWEENTTNGNDDTIDNSSRNGTNSQFSSVVQAKSIASEYGAEKNFLRPEQHNLNAIQVNGNSSSSRANYLNKFNIDRSRENLSSDNRHSDIDKTDKTSKFLAVSRDEQFVKYPTESIESKSAFRKVNEQNMGKLQRVHSNTSISSRQIDNYNRNLTNRETNQLYTSNNSNNRSEQGRNASSERLIVPGAGNSNSNEDDEICDNLKHSSTPKLDSAENQIFSHTPVRTLSKQFSVDQPYSSNESPPVEFQRMVLGETGSNSPTPSARQQKESSQHAVHNDETVKYPINHTKEKELAFHKKSEKNHHQNNRKDYSWKGRHHRRMDSDEEEYDVVDRRHESPDRTSHSYHSKDGARYTSRKPEPGVSKRNRENSFTQSQDESYYDDDDYDDDYDAPYRYYRRPQREHKQRHYNYDYFHRDERGYRTHREKPRRDLYNSKMEDDPYYHERPSRPSSRSDSDYRREPQDYYYTMPRYYGRPPQYELPDINYAMFYDRHNQFDLHNPLNMKELLHFREKDPKGYATWYKWYISQRKRMDSFTTPSSSIVAPQKTMKVASAYQPDRRGSGHASGQSSINGEVLGKSEEKLLEDMDDETAEDTKVIFIQEERHTPLKFSAPHTKGIFNSSGQLIVINPYQSQENENGKITIYQLTPSDAETELKEFLNFTGPFIIGETHINTVCDYLKYRAMLAGTNSEKLLHLLVNMIIKLRGRADGIAVSELLMENYKECGNPAQPKLFGNDIPANSPVENGDVSYNNSDFMEVYVQFLLQGDKSNALEWAVTNKQWGHALSLAYKMDMKHFTNILTLFDNSVSSNSPLTTLYQLLSGQLPQSVERGIQENKNDWRPHLAMILSNATTDTDLSMTAVEKLANSLASQHDIFAAHFCYLTIQLNFELTNFPASKYYTLLSLPNNQLLQRKIYKIIPAIMLTQACEFALRLQQKNFVIPSLLPYKFLLAQILVTYGRFNVAFQYLEMIGTCMCQNSTLYDEVLVGHVVDLADRIKYRITNRAVISDGSNLEQWLFYLQSQLGRTNSTFQITHSASSTIQQHTEASVSSLQEQAKTDSQQEQQTQQSFYQPNLYNPLQHSTSETISGYSQFQDTSNNYHYTQENLHAIPEMQGTYTNQIQNLDHNKRQDVPAEVNAAIDYSNTIHDNATIGNINTEDTIFPSSTNADQNSYSLSWNQQYQQPITISTKSSYSYFDNTDDHNSSDNRPSTKLENQRSSSSNADKESVSTNRDDTADKKFDNMDHAGSGWLGGIFGKLSLRPKNQMKLPDDKNKTIVWSEEKKKWINIVDGDAESENALKPPPKMSKVGNYKASESTANKIPPNNILASNLQTQPNKPNINVSSSSSSSNMYKMSRGKGMKANYVNVLAQSSSNQQLSSNPVPDGFSSLPPQPNMKLFLPTSSGNAEANDNYSGPSSLNNRQVSKNSDSPIFYNPSQYAPL